MPLAVLLNPDDPNFIFEHMMQHRQYFAVLTDLSHYSELPYLLDPAFNTDVPAERWNLSHQQAHKDFNSDLPNSYADGFYQIHVTPPTATATGNSTGTTNLTVSGVVNTIIIGATVTGTGVPAGTTIVSQTSGTAGKDGVYVVSQPTTLTNIALSITHPPYWQGVPLPGGAFGIAQSQILLEGTGQSPENRSWWTFVNHQQHFITNEAILPLPTDQPTTVGEPPGQITASNPWWWIDRYPIIYPYW